MNLLDQGLYQDLITHPEKLEGLIDAAEAKEVVIDEIQRVPDLLNEVHRLIESRRANSKIQFILTGSSARKLRRSSSNLLAGRAFKREMHPLTAMELGEDFNLKQSLRYGHLPGVVSQTKPKDFLKSYVGTYLREEILQESLVRNLPQFSRFLEAAAFSQAQVLNVQSIASDLGVDRKTAENYFTILEDLMLGYRIPVFSKRAKRRLVQHPKFFYFDVGVYRTLRQLGPLDSTDEIDGVSLESLVFQELKGVISNAEIELELFYWRSVDKSAYEVDFVLYGPDGFFGIEVKKTHSIKAEHLRGLKAFLEDYPQAKGLYFYGGTRAYREGKIEIIPAEMALGQMSTYLGSRRSIGSRK